MFGEPFRVDRRRSDDDFQVGAFALQSPEIAEQKVDIQGAFVRFIDDDRVICIQKSV